MSKALKSWRRRYIDFLEQGWFGGDCPSFDELPAVDRPFAEFWADRMITTKRVTPARSDHGTPQEAPQT